MNCEESGQEPACQNRLEYHTVRFNHMKKAQENLQTILSNALQIITGLIRRAFFYLYNTTESIERKDRSIDMKEIYGALFGLVVAHREAETLQNAFVKVGLNDNPIFNIRANIMDAISHIIGEHLDEDQDFIKDSVTSITLSAPFLTDERRTEMLFAEYKKNYPSQPKPNTFEQMDMQKMFRESGGYMTPEGDWS